METDGNTDGNTDRKQSGKIQVVVTRAPVLLADFSILLAATVAGYWLVLVVSG